MDPYLLKGGGEGEGKRGIEDWIDCWRDWEDEDEFIRAEHREQTKSKSFFKVEVERVKEECREVSRVSNSSVRELKRWVSASSCLKNSEFRSFRA